MTKTIKKSFCHLCMAHCGIKVTVDNDKIVKIVSDFDDPVSQGYICEKAQKLIDYQHSKDRITEPLKKVGEKFISISWKQAIDEIVDKLKTIKQRDRILYMAPAIIEYKSVYKYELMKKLGVKFVTNVFSMEKIYPVLVQKTLLQAHTKPDRKNSQVHIIVGQNLWVTQHYPRARKLLLDIKNDSNRKLIVIDPCDTDTTKMSDYHLKINPGSDAWVMIALIKIIIDNNYVDLEFINKRTVNYNKILQYFSKVNLKDCLTICNISREQLLEIAKLIYQADGVSIASGNGICHTPNALANNYLFELLHLLTGNYQNLGGMISINNDISQDMASTHYFTEPTVPWGTQKQVDGITSASFIVDNLYVDEDQHFECVFIDCNNPVARFPDSDKFISQLNKVDLVVALDSFHTASTKYADYILPIPTFLESYEISAVEHNLARLSKPVIESDQITAERIYEIFLERLDLIDHKMLKKLIEKYRSNRLEFVEILANNYRNKDPIVYYVLYRTVGLQYKNPIVSLIWWKIFIVFKEENKSTEQALDLADTAIEELNTVGWTQVDLSINVDHGLIDLTGTYLLHSLKALNLELSDSNYKFVLQCGYRQKDSINGIVPNTKIPLLEVNIHDLKSMDIEDGQEVLLQTESTSIQIKCKAVDNLQSGLIRISNHAIINKLSNTKNRDYLNPQYKFVFANIGKINGTS